MIPTIVHGQAFHIIKNLWEGTPGDMLEKNITFYTRLITVFMTVSFGENMLMFFFINGYI
jgi:hypothetical protein